MYIYFSVSITYRVTTEKKVDTLITTESYDFYSVLAFNKENLKIGDTTLIKYITADIARLGSDKAVIMVWDGWAVIEIVEFDISRLTEIQNTINALRVKYNIPLMNVVCDEDGVGGGLVDELNGCYGFVNNSTCLNGENYANLKSQCSFKLAELVEAHKIYIEEFEYKDLLIQELEQIRMKDVDKDGKLRIIGKDMIKQNIGRSPDFYDALMMRMVFEIETMDQFSLFEESLF
jgi:hypothetical protein